MSKGSWKNASGRTLFTADPHFGHENVIRHCARPFGSAAEMDRAMIANWNAVVGPNDTVHVIGDFAYKIGGQDLRGIFDALHGQKHLVIGNHDGLETLRLPWSTPPEHRRHIIVDGVSLVLDHYAGRTWYRSNRGSIQLFGHSHGRMSGTNQSIDVGVDVWDFLPVDLPQIQARLATLPPFHEQAVEADEGFEP